MTIEKLNGCCAERHAPEFYDSEGGVLPHDAQDRDHHTSKKIARLLGWNSQGYQDPNSRIPMHRACHNLKDASTKARIKFLENIKKSNRVVTLDDYRKFRNSVDLVFSDNGNGHKGNGTVFEAEEE